MFKKLRNKMLIVNMTIISVMVIAAFTAVYLVMYTNVRKENEDKLSAVPAISGRAILAESIALQETEWGLANDIGVTRSVMFLPSDYSLSFSIVLDEDGNIEDLITFIDMPDEVYLEAAELAMAGENESDSIQLEGKTWQYKVAQTTGALIIESNDPNGVSISSEKTNQISFLDVSDSYRTLSNLLITFIIAGVFMLFLIYLISLYFANRAIKPISEAWTKQKQFIADASHEFKTPIAIISANSDALLANQEDTIMNQRRWVDYIKAETERMGRLVGDLLYLAKTEDAAFKFDEALLDVSAMVNEAIVSMEAVAFEKGLKLFASVEADVIYKGDGEKLKQVVLILLDNAIKYSEPGNRVDLTLKRIRTQIMLSVSNSGTGIPNDELGKLFDRFYRSDQSRSRENAGYGLGLPIAKAIIERLGGRIYAKSVEGENMTFTFVV